MNRQIRVLLAAVLCCFMAVTPGQALSGETYLKNGSIVSGSGFAPEDDYKVITLLPSGNNQLLDYAHGYALEYPSDMTVDVSLSAFRVVLANTSTRIEIYHDVFYDTINNSTDYVGYSNKSLLNNRQDHYVAMDKYISIGGMKTHLLQWNRAPLARVENDRNNYLSAEIIRNNYEAFTIIVKSTGDPAAYLPYVQSFRLIEQQGTPRINTRYTKSDHVSRLNPETQEFYQRFFSPLSRLQWGIYEYSAGENFDFLESLEKQLDYQFHILVWYKSLNTSLPRELMDRAYAKDKYLELTFHTEVAGADNRSVMYDILNGHYDDYFSQYARDIKAFGHPVLFRLNNEMNGDWCSWSSWHSSKDPELFKAVWRHIYQIFEANGVDNCLWVFNPNEISFPGFKWNHYLAYFPGSEYVDIVGLTGYNTGNYFNGESWRSFETIYDPIYGPYMQVFDYPFIITEFACSSFGGNKEAWIIDMFGELYRYPNIKVANWFNGIDRDSAGNPARIYRLDESPAYVSAFSRGLKGETIRP